MPFVFIFWLVCYFIQQRNIQTWVLPTVISSGSWTTMVFIFDLSSSPSYAATDHSFHILQNPLFLLAYFWQGLLKLLDSFFFDELTPCKNRIQREQVSLFKDAT